MPYIRIADILDQLATPVDAKLSAAEQKERDDQLSRYLEKYHDQILSFLKKDAPKDHIITTDTPHAFFNALIRASIGSRNPTIITKRLKKLSKNRQDKSRLAMTSISGAIKFEDDKNPKPSNYDETQNSLIDKENTAPPNYDAIEDSLIKLNNNLKDIKAESDTHYYFDKLTELKTDIANFRQNVTNQKQEETCTTILTQIQQQLTTLPNPPLNTTKPNEHKSEQPADHAYFQWLIKDPSRSAAALEFFAKKCQEIQVQLQLHYLNRKVLALRNAARAFERKVTAFNSEHITIQNHARETAQLKRNKQNYSTYQKAYKHYNKAYLNLQTNYNKQPLLKDRLRAAYKKEVNTQYLKPELEYETLLCDYTDKLNQQQEAKVYNESKATQESFDKLAAFMKKNNYKICNPRIENLKLRLKTVLKAIAAIQLTPELAKAAADIAKPKAAPTELGADNNQNNYLHFLESIKKEILNLHQEAIIPCSTTSSDTFTPCFIMLLSEIAQEDKSINLQDDTLINNCDVLLSLSDSNTTYAITSLKADIIGAHHYSPVDEDRQLYLKLSLTPEGCTTKEKIDLPTNTLSRDALLEMVIDNSNKPQSIFLKKYTNIIKPKTIEEIISALQSLGNTITATRQHKKNSPEFIAYTDSISFGALNLSTPYFHTMLAGINEAMATFPDEPSNTQLQHLKAGLAFFQQLATGDKLLTAKPAPATLSTTSALSASLGAGSPAIEEKSPAKKSISPQPKVNAFVRAKVDQAITNAVSSSRTSRLKRWYRRQNTATKVLVCFGLAITAIGIIALAATGIGAAVMGVSFMAALSAVAITTTGTTSAIIGTSSITGITAGAMMYRLDASIDPQTIIPDSLLLKHATPVKQDTPKAEVQAANSKPLTLSTTEESKQEYKTAKSSDRPTKLISNQNPALLSLSQSLMTDVSPKTQSLSNSSTTDESKAALSRSTDEDASPTNQSPSPVESPKQSGLLPVVPLHESGSSQDELHTPRPSTPQGPGH